MEFCALHLGCVALHFGSKNVKNNATIYIKGGDEPCESPS